MDGFVNNPARNAPRNSNYGLLISTSSPLRLSGLNCSVLSNSGVLTTDSSGNVICDDDDGGAGGGGSTTTIAGLTPSNGVFSLATGSATGLDLHISTTSPRTITFTPTL